ncbi:unnamed protein product [Prorocentrum cordatum]|uniref:Uncharacterized protein n=1 Tax=Prorocentrum cordatum TaxID=2364126 RepID=A0ABN9SYL2_9DINO|nr:unnamed protein product [Polarella glacialis]
MIAVLKAQLQPALSKVLHMVSSLGAGHVAFTAFVSLYVWFLPAATTHLLLAVLGAASYGALLMVQELGFCEHPGKQGAGELPADQGAQPGARPAVARGPRARRAVAEPQRKDPSSGRAWAGSEDCGSTPPRAADQELASSRTRPWKKKKEKSPAPSETAAPGSGAAPRPEGKAQLCAGLAAARRAIDKGVPPAGPPACRDDAVAPPTAEPACQAGAKEQLPSASAPAAATAELAALSPLVPDGFEEAAVTKAAKRRRAAQKKLNEASEGPHAKP